MVSDANMGGLGGSGSFGGGQHRVVSGPSKKNWQSPTPDKNIQLPSPRGLRACYLIHMCVSNIRTFAIVHLPSKPHPVTMKAMAIRRAALHISSVAMLIRRAALHISSVAMLICRAALHTSSVAMLIRRAALHISSVKMAYLQSIRRASTCSKSNISQRRRNR